MKTPTLLFALATLVTQVGCGFPITFTCAANEPACPAAQPCPQVPLGSGGCETLPGLFGQPTTPVDAGRPVGCDVGLPYGNPNYGGLQQHCRCADVAGTSAQWQCPI